METIAGFITAVGIVPAILFFVLLRQEKTTKENIEVTRELRDELRKMNGFAAGHLDRHHRGD
jgi:hypothetical protein